MEEEKSVSSAGQGLLEADYGGVGLGGGVVVDMSGLLGSDLVAGCVGGSAWRSCGTCCRNDAVNVL